MTQVGGTIQIADWDGETSNVQPNLPDATAALANANNLATDLDEIKDAVAALIRGVIRKVVLCFTFPESGAEVTDIEASREGKWLVSYRDNTPFLGAANTFPNPGYTKLFSFEIPTADRTLLPDGTDELDLTDGAVAPSVAALEANIRSPYNRNAGGVTVVNVIESIKYVGRDL